MKNLRSRDCEEEYVEGDEDSATPLILDITQNWTRKIKEEQKTSESQLDSVL